ncbi:MAG: proline--tRNA ligase [Spirochaetales bacterium]
MRASKLFFETYKETPNEAEIKSHKLMLRAGLIKQQASGIYAYMPLGFKVLKKIENIIREEMNKAGAQELLMPGLVPQEVYEGRLEKFGSDMFKLKDRNGKDFCLTPTHEELFTLAVKDFVKSYKQLPITLYQFQTKYRDERRPRFGLQRSREFIMKDAYSFDMDYSGLEDSYIAMYNAYLKAFKRLGLDFVSVMADSGSMGGSRSEEFMVKSEVGEDTIVFCKHCNYSANEEKAISQLEPASKEAEKEIKKVHTPNVKTIEEVTKFLKVDANKLVKTLIYIADKNPVAVMIRGNREVQEVKLANALGANEVRLASAEEVEFYVNCPSGFVGGKGLKIKTIADVELKNLKNFVMGANVKDYHYVDANLKDCKIDEFADIRKVQAGDMCPQCGKQLEVMKGIEVGHIFQLGTKYSERLNLKVLDENGKEVTVVMGSYGIGLGRTMAAIVEQLSDDKGIIWSEGIAPFDASIIAVNQKDEAQVKAAEDLYLALKNANLDVLLDDRTSTFGNRIKDSELLGIPFIIVAGKRANEGIYEFIDRKTGVKTEVTKDTLFNKKA